MDKHEGKRLTTKQKLFVAKFTGNASQAARDAGLSPDYGRELISKSYIREAIRHREFQRLNKELMGTEAIQGFWCDMIQDEDADPTHKLKASELLARSMCLFRTVTEISGPIQMEHKHQKITTPEDVAMLRALIAERTQQALPAPEAKIIDIKGGGKC